MTEQAVAAGDAGVVDGGVPLGNTFDLPALEQRVRRLEDAVAQLQDTRYLEDRVLERLAARGRLNAVRDSAGLILDAGRQLLPVAADVIRTETRAAESHARATPAAAPRTWLAFDIFADVRTMVKMFFDRRYRLSWTCRVVPAILLIFILLSQWLVPGAGIPLLGPILDKLIDVVLALVALKILSREAARYRAAVPTA
jgi:hypothetical protein